MAITYLGEDQQLHRCPVGSYEPPGDQGVRDPVSTLRNPDGARAAVTGNLLLGPMRACTTTARPPANAPPTSTAGWPAAAARPLTKY